MGALDYFDQEETVCVRGQNFQVYLTPPKKGPLVVFHHGMGSSALTFAVLVKDLQDENAFAEAGFLAYDARFHGKTRPVDPHEKPNYDADVLTEDCATLVKKVVSDLHYNGPIMLVGHSMGGKTVSTICSNNLIPNVQALVVLDAVEAYALQALGGMPALVRSWPTSFSSPKEAVEWSLSHYQLRNRVAAELSVPAMLQFNPGDDRFHWVVDLMETKPYWESWFKGLDTSFLKSPAAKLLVLAGTGRLDKELMLAQMQGKYQLVVLNECGHFIQEDEPRKLAITLGEFWTRNQRPAVIPKFGAFRT